MQKIESEKGQLKTKNRHRCNQIRSYVLHLWMVKDLRNNYEDADPDAVLDGEIDKLIFSNIK